MQKYAKICKQLQKYAIICKNMQKYAKYEKICKKMQKYAKICEVRRFSNIAEDACKTFLRDPSNIHMVKKPGVVG